MSAQSRTRLTTPAPVAGHRTPAGAWATAIRCLRQLLAAACLLLGATPLLAAPDAPAMMVLSGRIAASALGPTPGPNDLVLAFSAVDGRFVGDGRVGDRGEFAIAIGNTASFNGTPVVLELQHGRGRFELLRDGQPAWFKFAGKALPDRVEMNLVPGRQTAELADLEIKQPEAQRLSRQVAIPCDPLADANGDGRCDASDWEILQLFGGGVTRTVGRP